MTSVVIQWAARRPTSRSVGTARLRIHRGRWPIPQDHGAEVRAEDACVTDDLKIRSKLVLLVAGPIVIIVLLTAGHAAARGRADR